MSQPPDLSPRQVQILTDVVASYIATGHPVGSRTLVETNDIDASPSTVRYELAELENRGLLNHPHTSAGRVPTDAGYRLYAELLLQQPLGAASLPVDLSATRSEIDSALRATTEMLSHVTSLLALVTAPPRLPLLPARPEARAGLVPHRHRRAARQPRRRAPRDPVPGGRRPGRRGRGPRTPPSPARAGPASAAPACEGDVRGSTTPTGSAAWAPGGPRVVTPRGTASASTGAPGSSCRCTTTCCRPRRPTPPPPACGWRPAAPG